MNKFQVYTTSIIVDEIDSKFCAKRFDEKKRKSKCRDFLLSLNGHILSDGCYECPFGYSAIRSTHHVLCGFVTDYTSQIALKKIKGHIRNSGLEKPELLKDDMLTKCRRRLIEEDYLAICSLSVHDLINCVGILNTVCQTCKTEGVTGEPAKLMELYKGYDSACKRYSEGRENAADSNDFELKKVHYKRFLDDAKSLCEYIDKHISGIADYEERYKNNPLLMDLYSLQSLFRFRIRYHDLSMKQTQEVDSGQRATGKESNINLHKITKKLISIQHLPAKKKGVAFELRGSTYNTIRGKDSIFLAFYILYENAVKYALPNSTIVVELCDSEDITTIRISNASGYISPESMRRLTEKGFSGENVLASRSSGLGLFLASELLRENNVEFHLLYQNGRFIVSAVFRNCAPQTEALAHQL